MTNQTEVKVVYCYSNLIVCLEKHYTIVMVVLSCIEYFRSYCFKYFEESILEFSEIKVILSK